MDLQKLWDAWHNQEIDQGELNILAEQAYASPEWPGEYSVEDALFGREDEEGNVILSPLRQEK